MTYAIEARDVSVRIGSKTLVDAVSMAFRPGERVALVGPNGAGKTTLLRALAGELKPATGTIRLRGVSVAALSAEALALRRAVLSQSITVAFPFTVPEVVLMGIGRARGPAVERLLAETLDELDLAALASRTVTTLSGGEQQRTQLARALVQLACGEAETGPGMLFLDEPTASLDLRHQLDVLDAAKRRAGRGTTVVAVLHDLNLAALFADRIVYLKRGRLVTEGSPRATMTDQILSQVFDVGFRVSKTPPDQTPFVLPQTAAAMSPQE